MHAPMHINAQKKKKSFVELNCPQSLKQHSYVEITAWNGARIHGKKIRKNSAGCRLHAAFYSEIGQIFLRVVHISFRSKRTWICRRIFTRSKGATTVLLTAADTPPATKSIMKSVEFMPPPPILKN
jgi:hypothetical protein